MVGSSRGEPDLLQGQTDFIRFLAIILITNSHIPHLYPHPQLATGGALGNALFFMVSGYGLARSHLRSARPFPSWYGRRVLRIYPSVFIVTVMFEFLLHRRWEQWAAGDYLSALVWPTNFWFVGALMLFYPFFYLTLKRLKGPGYLLLMAAFLIPYGYFYVTALDLSLYTIEGEGYFKWIFYFQVMLFGGYLGMRDRFAKAGLRHILLLACLAGMYGVCGFLFLRGQWTAFQAVMHILTVPMLYLVFLIARSPFITERLLNRKPLRWVVTAVAGATLEIYLLQYQVYSSPAITFFGFPLNLIVFSVVLFLLSHGLARFSAYLRRAAAALPY